MLEYRSLKLAMMQQALLSVRVKATNPDIKEYNIDLLLMRKVLDST